MPFLESDVPRAFLPTKFGEFEVFAFLDSLVALKSGNIENGCLVRIHSGCSTGDIFCSLRCDCREQLEYSLNRISSEGGLLIYNQSHEGRGIGLKNKIKAYSIQERGAGTYEANRMLGFKDDERAYSREAEVLRFFGLERIRLLTNNPEKAGQLRSLGFVVEPVNMPVRETLHNRKYLNDKRSRGHSIEINI